MARAGQKAVIAIAGSSGLIGSALAAALRADDHRVLRIVRRAPANGDELSWNPESGDLDPDALRGVDAVVNLCGVNIGKRRWSGAFKQSLRDSRITPTEVLAHAVADAGVATLVNASAVGFYGNTKDRVVDENDRAGTGFLAQLCQDWEAATLPAQYGGARVVLARTGLVFSPPVARWAGCGPCSGPAWAPGWAVGGSTCRGSRWKTRCGPCCSRSSSPRCPAR